MYIFRDVGLVSVDSYIIISEACCHSACTQNMKRLSYGLMYIYALPPELLLTADLWLNDVVL